MCSELIYLELKKCVSYTLSGGEDISVDWFGLFLWHINIFGHLMPNPVFT